MAQTTRFPAIPNTEPPAYQEVITGILGEIRRETPSPKALREFLRMGNLFDKPTHLELLQYLDVRVDRSTTSLGPFALAVLEAPDEPAFRRLMADRLLTTNPLLAKYCLEALDTEQGGRLHSTNELYRMLTSYVYPGEEPDLPSFKAWIQWAVASGLLRLVGIRWALGVVGTESIPRLRAIDVEEFLEEEKAGEDTPATEDPAPPGPTEPVVKTPDAEPLESACGDRPMDHPPPEAEGPADLDAARDALVAWYEGYPGKRPLCLSDSGVDPKARAPAALYEAAFMALLLDRGLRMSSVQTALAAFREMALMPTLGKGHFPLEAIQKAVRESGDPDFVTACEAAVHGARLLSAVEQPRDLVRGDDPGELLWTLWRRLFEPVAPLAPFLMARYLYEAGRLPDEMASAAFVPWFVVRENAFRIGFTDRVVAEGFQDLVTLGTDLGRRFGSPAFEGPLLQAHEGLGCRFLCDRLRVCPVPCREKREIGR
ncbi:MAG: hypothetical protein ISR64_02100 [Deltaproteobacteria bacterium]|nr:hypothetical protein [Deltaproteobacteria bacterium]